MRFDLKLLLAACAAVFCVLPDAKAQTVAPAPHTELIEEAEPQPLEEAPEQASGIEFVDVIVEGQLTSVRTQTVDEDTLHYNLTDIAAPLQSKVELHDTLLGYHRRQDGILMDDEKAIVELASYREISAEEIERYEDLLNLQDLGIEDEIVRRRVFKYNIFRGSQYGTVPVLRQLTCYDRGRGVGLSQVLARCMLPRDD